MNRVESGGLSSKNEGERKSVGDAEVELVRAVISSLSSRSWPVVSIVLVIHSKMPDLPLGS